MDRDQHLVLAAPAPATQWTSKRFSRLIGATASELGRDFRFASEAEQRAFDACAQSDPSRINTRQAAR